jgi:hypothetical protein
MLSSGMLCRVALVRTDISFLHSMHRLLVTANIVIARQFFSQKKAFFIVTAVKISDFTCLEYVNETLESRKEH